MNSYGTLKINIILKTNAYAEPIFHSISYLENKYKTLSHGDSMFDCQKIFKIHIINKDSQTRK